MRSVRANGIATVLLGAVALATAGMGCEIIASVDRSLIPSGTGGLGGSASTTSTGGAGGAGGMKTTSSSSTSSSSSTTTSSSSTTSTSSSGTGGTGTGGTGGTGTGGAEPDAGTDSGLDSGADGGTDSGSDAAACTATEKMCNGACVAIDDPSFGCGTTTCSACAAPGQCQAAAACDTTTNACTYPAVSDGTACNDGNACTQTDTCVGGVCMGMSPVTCAASDQCHTAGTCNTATGVCSNPPASNGTACNDGDACTLTDTCQSGTCTGSNPVTCAAADQCHVAGTCNGATGVCSNPPVADNTTCNDGNACTDNDVCTSGTCAGTSYACAAPGQCQQAGTCNGDGTCSFANLADNTTCTAAAQCGLIGACQAGACTGPCSSGLCGTSLSAFTGAQTTGWNFNGNAFYDGTKNTAVLVDGTVTSGQAGTLIYKDPITVDAFTVSFDFLMTTSSPYSRADGIAFMIETNGSTAVGSGYGGFGVLGLSGYAAELDIFDSGPCDPGNGNHAGIDLLSACSNNSGIPSAIATSGDLYAPVDAGDNGIGDIGDGTWRTATVTLASGQLSMSITDPSTGSPVAVPNLQNVALPGFVSGTPYYFGFGAGSGSNSQASRQEIRNVAVTFGTNRCL